MEDEELEAVSPESKARILEIVRTSRSRKAVVTNTPAADLGLAQGAHCIGDVNPETEGETTDLDRKVGKPKVDKNLRVSFDKAIYFSIQSVVLIQAALEACRHLSTVPSIFCLTILPACRNWCGHRGLTSLPTTRLAWTQKTTPCC